MCVPSLMLMYFHSHSHSVAGSKQVDFLSIQIEMAISSKTKHFLPRKWPPNIKLHFSSLKIEVSRAREIVFVCLFTARGAFTVSLNKPLVHQVTE